jgi:catechol 2,3-dioxygenase-like lactoylglutathione lyase family enzyme
MLKKLCCNLHHVSMLVDDVDEAFARYEILLGLHGEKLGDCAVMRCAHEDFCLVLKPANGRKPFLDYVAYELSAGVTLNDARREIDKRIALHPERSVSQSSDEKVRMIDVPIRGEGLLLNDPDENRVVLVERNRPEDPRPAIMIPTTTLRGYHPRRLGHVNYLTSNVKRLHAWYENVLGFKTTDWFEDAAVWMHVDARHHVLAFLEKGDNHIHHIAFELMDWGEMRVALDHIAKHGRYVTWGPLRHGMAQNLASYWRMWEEEHFIELYCDMQVLDDDHAPLVHPDNRYASNTWGSLPPRSYFRFDKESVEKERDSAHSFVDV